MQDTAAPSEVPKNARWDGLLEAARSNPDMYVATTHAIRSGWSTIRTELLRAMARTGIRCDINRSRGRIILRHRAHQSYPEHALPYVVISSDEANALLARGDIGTKQILAALTAEPDRPIKIPHANRTDVERVRIAAKRAGLAVRTVKVGTAFYIALAEN